MTSRIMETPDWPYMIWVYHETDKTWYPFIGYDTPAECSHFLSLQPMLRPAKIVKQEIISAFDKTSN